MNKCHGYVQLLQSLSGGGAPRPAVHTQHLGSPPHWSKNSGTFMTCISLLSLPDWSLKLSFWLPVCYKPVAAVPPQPKTAASGPSSLWTHRPTASQSHLLHHPKAPIHRHCWLLSILPSTFASLLKVTVTLATNSTLSHLVCGRH